MNIHFFEEFPTPDQLAPAQHLQYPATIYLAARSADEFQQYQAQLSALNPRLKAGYWPILSQSYWISPFCDPAELEALHRDLSSASLPQKTPLLLDLELPLRHPTQFVKNLRHFRRNRHFLQHMMQTLGQHYDILTAEYPFHQEFWQRQLQRLGLSYSLDDYPHRKIVMYYTSIVHWPWLQKHLQGAIIRKARTYGHNFQVGLGTIATGIFGNEPILLPEQLKRDLQFLTEHHIRDAVIFRLGGLDQRYLEIIHEYQYPQASGTPDADLSTR